MRLSFITVNDQTKFEHLFRTAVPKGEQAILGDSARDILLRSGLAPVALAEIWSLADTNKLGSLLFPEFALALHLCNLALRGDPLPGYLPEKWQNEVQSFVDAISFAVPEDPNKILANTPFSSFGSEQKPNTDWMSMAPQATGSAPLPPTSFVAQPTGGVLPPAGSLTSQRTGGGTLIPLQPQQTASFVPAQRTGGLTSQTTGYQQPQLNAQTTGYLGQQPQLAAQRTGSMPPTSFTAQPTGTFQSQGTGYQSQQSNFQSQQTPLQSQGTGFQGSGFQPQQTGNFQSQVGFQPQQTGGYLQSQPTGKPGQWGFVSMPTGGIPGLNAMQLHFLPSSQAPSNNLQNQMGGHLKENVTWSITKQEKQIYDGIFGAWDTTRRGYIDGETAISIFGKSGLGRPDLESIWNLCDTSNRGKLNKDEFSVAMHLVYRRLNGFDIPLRLPPELVPPSAKYLQDSVDLLKNSLKGGASKKAAAPQKQSTTASRFKNDDDNVGYVSNSRHRSRRPTDQQPNVPNSNTNDLTVADLKKLIREKQILLDATDLEDQHNSIANKQANETNQRQIESLKYQIKEVQSQINKLALGGSPAEKRHLLDQLNILTKDKTPALVARVYDVNSEIAKVKTQLAKARLQKEYPDWQPDKGDEIVGTGPNGEVTQNDIRKFKSKQTLKKRMAELTGKAYSDGSNEDADLKLQQEVDMANHESQNQSAIIRDIESSIKELEDGASVYLQVSVKTETGENKWEKGEGVSSAMKHFIEELSAFSLAQVKQSTAGSYTSQQTKQTSSPASSSDSAPRKSAPSYKTPEERSAYIKSQAEKRMQERLVKLGISRKKTTDGFEDSQQETKEIPREAPRASEQVKAPEPVKAPEAPKVQIPEPVAQPKQLPIPTQTPKSANGQAESESDDEEDAEYAALLKQKQEMEARKKERELKKKKDREERMARLKREMAALENDESDEEPAISVPLYTPTNSKAKSEAVSEPTTATKSVPVFEPKGEQNTGAPSASQSVASQETQGPHKSNPFAKFSSSGTTDSAASSLTPGANTNPFFKSKTAEPVDQKKIDAQRASQRGLGSESWSDDEAGDSSEDDEPNRAGAAKLASLLFGGMPQPLSRATTGNAGFSQQNQPPAPQQSTVHVPQAPPIPQTPPIPQAPPVPQAPPIPQQVTAPTSEAPPIPVAPPQAPQAPRSSNEEETSSDSDDEFATPSPPTYPSDGPGQVPPAPSQAPPVPSAQPGPPPVPTQVPPIPTGVPPPPPPPPTGLPPPPSFMSAPSAPPPPPSMGVIGSTGGAPNIGALLGQIQGGKSLKKVDENEKHISDSATVGRVL